MSHSVYALTNRMIMLTSQQIQAMPEYKALRAARRKIILPLAGIVISAYFFLILTIGFFPKALGVSFIGGVTSFGIAAGFGLILLCFAVTGVYVSYANRKIEPLVKAITQKAKGEL
ncbi:DUF485 domain-containing protein [Marinagarivorans cellulosilyticus]|nr:DUF485 domain-containing protein [Marinagarivorans cellulosilyticus]